METGGEGDEDVVSADVQADQGLTVEAVGEVRHVHPVQAAVGQLQALQRSVERTGKRKESLKEVNLCRIKGQWYRNWTRFLW